jgi:hypothetical protein
MVSISIGVEVLLSVVDCGEGPCMAKMELMDGENEL